MLGLILFAGGLGCAAFHPPGAALAHRLGGDRPRPRDVGPHHRRLAGLRARPVALRAVRGALSASSGRPLLAIPGLIVAAIAASRVPPFEPAAQAGDAGFRALRPYAKPLACLYLIVVLRTLTSLAFATFVPVMLTRRGMRCRRRGRAGRSVSVCERASAGFSADRPRTVSVRAASSCCRSCRRCRFLQSRHC